MLLRRIAPAWLDGLLLVVWMGIIFYLSDQPDPHVPAADILLVRKAMHMAEYLLLFVLWLRVLQHRFNWPLMVRTALLATVAYAISDELHQHWVGRDGNALDVCIDSVVPVLCWIRTEVRRTMAHLPHPPLSREPNQ